MEKEKITPERQQQIIDNVSNLLTRLYDNYLKWDDGEEEEYTHDYGNFIEETKHEKACWNDFYKDGKLIGDTGFKLVEVYYNCPMDEFKANGWDKCNFNRYPKPKGDWEIEIYIKVEHPDGRHEVFAFGHFYRLYKWEAPVDFYYEGYGR